VPKSPSALLAALDIKHKATVAGRGAVERCGALCCSFREGADVLQRLAGISVSISKLRKMVLAFGECCVLSLETPATDRRQYAHKPTKAVTPVERTLFCMADGGAANCCKADTKNIVGKNGEAETRQIRVAVFGEYAWLDKKNRPAPWPESFSYAVSGDTISEVTPLIKKHGLSRGSGVAPRMICLADGESALEKALRDCFPHAVFINDFAHAAGHLHDCCEALGLDEGVTKKEFRFCKGLLYRSGAQSVSKRLRRLYQTQLDASPQAIKELLYLEKRIKNMQYGQFRKNGYYIGSGHVEAAVRIIIARRCKQAGMHWRHVNAVRMAAIHATYRSFYKAT